MKFPLKKSKNRFNLLMGLLWLVLFLTDVIFLTINNPIFTYVKIFLAFVYLFQYFHSTIKKQFEITDEFIKLFHIPVKEIKIIDITNIKKQFDEYEIISNKTKITISTQSLDKEYQDLFTEKIQEIQKKLSFIS